MCVCAVFLVHTFTTPPSGKWHFGGERFPPVRQLPPSFSFFRKEFNLSVWFFGTNAIQKAFSNKNVYVSYFIATFRICFYSSHTHMYVHLPSFFLIMAFNFFSRICLFTCHFLILYMPKVLGWCKHNVSFLPLTSTITCFIANFFYIQEQPLRQIFVLCMCSLCHKKRKYVVFIISSWWTKSKSDPRISFNQNR